MSAERKQETIDNVVNFYKNRNSHLLPVDNMVNCADGCLLGWYYYEYESEPIWQGDKLAKELRKNDDAIWDFKFCPYCGRKLSN